MSKIKKVINLMRRAARRAPRAAEFTEIERAERIFYLEYLREDMTVFDVGANIGELTLLFSRFAAEVHSFEPSAETFKRLEAVCTASGRRNVHLNHLAISDRKKMIRLNVYEKAYSEFSSEAVRPLKNYGLDLEPATFEEIPALSVDEYCADQKIERIDLLKIDVEGAELQVMEGARKMLEEKRIGCLTFEFGQTTFDMGNRPEEIEKLLGDVSYRIGNIVRGEPTFPGRQSVESARYSMHVARPLRK